MKETDTDYSINTETPADTMQPDSQPLSPFLSCSAIPREALFTAPVLHMLKNISALRIPVLIVGEPGLGQNVLCQLVREENPDKGELFLELYAQSGASGDPLHTLYEIFQNYSAEKSFRGSLVIHNVEHASLALQGTVLHMLEDEHISLPDGRQAAFAGRIIAITCEPLAGKLAQGNLLPSLYYKLTVAPIILKPLRERQDDIRFLAEIFLRESQKRLQVAPKNFSPEASNLLESYPWPGNLPELESVIYRSVLFASSATLGKEDILFESKISDKNLTSTLPRLHVMSKETPAPLQKETRDVPLALSINQLVAELSHEIKNPLVAIKTFIQLLPGHINDPEFLSEFFSVAAKSIDRIDSLTERMLEFAKLPPPNISRVRLAQLVDDVLKGLTRYLSKKDLQWKADVAEELPLVSVDHDHLYYALENIFLHIAHYAPEKQNVRISAIALPSAVQLSIAYSGEKTVQGLAFSSSTGEKITALEGLDLFLSQQIAEKNLIHFTKQLINNQTCITLTFSLS